MVSPLFCCIFSSSSFRICGCNCCGVVSIVVKYVLIAWLTWRLDGQVFCHCLKCRKFSSSTHTTFLFLPRSDFQLDVGSSASNGATTNGHSTKQDARLSNFTALHESGMNLTFHFCARCGTYIYKETDAEEQNDMVLVAAGTLDGAATGGGKGKGMGLEDVRIDKEFYVKDRLDWMKPLDGALQCERFV